MSAKKPFPITIAITLSIALSVAATVAAAESGFLDSILKSGQHNKPLINGTILNNDNKTYYILIIPTSQNVTIPPVNNTPPPIPPINNTGDNDTIPNPPPTPQPVPTCNADQVYNATTNKCDPKPVPPTPTPTPTPTPVPVNTTEKKIIVVGDLDDNTAGVNVFNTVKAKNPDIVIALGDLGYADNLAWFKSTYGKLNLVCVPGNHESANEDGTASIQAEAEKFCSLPWYFKVNNDLFFGINTNGDLTKQLTQVQSILTNTKSMEGIKEVHLETHKPCAAPPNAHHPVESKVKAFCDGFKSKVPSNVKFVNDAGHNHVMSANKDNTYITSGAGGRSHYTCGISAEFPFCDNVHFGYLEYTIKPDGTSSYKFYDYKGSIVK